MACPICCYDYYVPGNDEESIVSSDTASSSDKCSFICDTGKECKLRKTDEELCNVHCVYRTPIMCPSCLKEGCKVCYRTYFLTSLEDPHCMDCKKGFSIEYLLGYDGNLQRFTNKFVWGPLKEHRENMLLEQILARLPTFQLAVTEQISKERYKEKLSKVNERMAMIQEQNLEITKVLIVYEEYGVDVQHLVEKLEINRARLKKLIDFRASNGILEPSKEESSKEEKHKTHGNCLNKDEGCNGFINNKWECGICFMKVCSKCHNIKEKDHECDPDEVESIKVLKDIAKPCPGCNQMIERTMGCSQMWCTGCHNFFDWNSLKIIRKTQYTHNPEHIAWLAKNNQTLGNVNVQQEVNVCDIGFHHIISLNIPNEAKDILSETLRLCNEIREDVDRYRDPLEKNIEKHAIDYLRSKINKNDLKKLVQRNYKSSKKSEFANMHRMMYIDNVRTVLVFTVNELKRPHTQTEIDDILENTFMVLNNSRDYTEKNLKTLGDMFNSEKPHLSNISARSGSVEKKYTETFLKKLYKIRTEKFYIDYEMNQVLYKLTETTNQTEIIEYLKKNPDWIPTNEEILKAKEEYDNNRF